MEWTLERLQEEQQNVLSKMYNDQALAERSDLYYICNNYNLLLENMINLQEGK